MELLAGADVNGGGGSEKGKVLVPGMSEWVAVTGLSGDSAGKSQVFGNDAFVLFLALEEFLVE